MHPITDYQNYRFLLDSWSNYAHVKRGLLKWNQEAKGRIMQNIDARKVA